MSVPVRAYQHGSYPRSEAVVAATRGVERGRTTQAEVDAAYDADLDDFVAAQRAAGLDLYSNGLIRWQDIFRPLVDLSGGMDARTLVRWFDTNSFFRAPEVTGDLTLDRAVPSDVEDDSRVPEPRLATLPSPYLFSRAAHTSQERNGLMMDLTREILRPVTEALVARGYALIHLEEPWLPYFGIDGGDWGDVEKALMELREASEGARLVLHTSFGDAGPYIDRLRRLPVDAVGVDFVETDLDELGARWEVGIVAGILDGRRSPLEPSDQAAEFVVRVAETLEPSSVWITSNSDLEMLPQEVARRKVVRLGEVSALVKDRLR